MLGYKIVFNTFNDRYDKAVKITHMHKIVHLYRKYDFIVDVTEIKLMSIYSNSTTKTSSSSVIGFRYSNYIKFYKKFAVYY